MRPIVHRNAGVISTQPAIHASTNGSPKIRGSTRLTIGTATDSAAIGTAARITRYAFTASMFCRSRQQSGVVSKLKIVAVVRGEPKSAEGANPGRYRESE
jgi:hypothetical protein